MKKPYLGKRSPHWPAVRKKHLAKYPTCAACGGTENLEVHHRQPYHFHPDLELIDSNLITLCEHPGRNCHLTFGHGGNWRGFVPEVESDAAGHLQRVRMSAKYAKLGETA